MSTRKRLVIGNWKMNLGLNASYDLAQEIAQGIEGNEDCEVMVCPPATHLSTVSQVTHNSSLELGAQNTFYENEGPYTGEVSTPMLVDLGVKAVIVGHSERRVLFNEDFEAIQKKVDALMEQGLTTILCCGEPMEVRQAGKHKEFVEEQLRSALKNVSAEGASTKLVIAYEPIWAIGTGETATPEQAQEIHQHIRTLMEVKYGEVSEQLRIIYGGSCKPSNAQELFAQGDIDGGLIGSASLDATSFLQIVKA